jgi:hypothetical protein
VTLSVPRYDSASGVGVDGQEGGDLLVERSGNEVVISGNAAGLRDLARWCLALSDALAGPGSHVHLDPGVSLLDRSDSLIIQRDDALED